MSTSHRTIKALCVKEVWRSVVGYEGYYEVSTWGRVRSVDRVVDWYTPRWDVHTTKTFRGRVLKICLLTRDAAGTYKTPTVTLSKNGKLKPRMIHQLVLTSFVGPCPEGMECCHWDGDPTNNRLDNLRWDTRKNNHADKRRHGTLLTGERATMSRANREAKATIVIKWQSGKFPTVETLASHMGVPVRTVVSAINCKTLRGERKDNVVITAFNTTLRRPDWCKMSGLSTQLLSYRINVAKMSPEEALTKPDSKGNRLRLKGGVPCCGPR
jgi:hypothetical protein